MKLKLKHLAPYLPYEVKYLNTHEDFIEKEGIIHIDSIGSILKYEFLKPILRPLSDLTKEIEHISYTKDLEPNLKKIIPEDFFRKHWFLSIREDGHFSTNNGDGTCTGYTYKGASYDIIILLLEWHFDIYGLIKNGLAIDINTLYKSE